MKKEKISDEEYIKFLEDLVYNSVDNLEMNRAGRDFVGELADFLLKYEITIGDLLTRERIEVLFHFNRFRSEYPYNSEWRSKTKKN